MIYPLFGKLPAIARARDVLNVHLPFYADVFGCFVWLRYVFLGLLYGSAAEVVFDNVPIKAAVCALVCVFRPKYSQRLGITDVGVFGKDRHYRRALAFGVRQLMRRYRAGRSVCKTFKRAVVLRLPPPQTALRTSALFANVKNVFLFHKPHFQRLFFFFRAKF